MKLVVAVVDNASVAGLARALAEHGLLSTQIQSRGGFLEEPNTTFLIGVEEERLGVVKRLLFEKAETRVVEREGVRVEVGGAVAFVLEVGEVWRL
jgi:uncharacterized protein YaaQ